jgi:predicted transcriptional regulator
MAQKKTTLLHLTENDVRTSVTAYMMDQKMTKTTMARIADIPYTRFVKLLSGSLEISAKTAIKLLFACECKIITGTVKKKYGN